MGIIYMSVGIMMAALKVVYLEKVVRSVRKDMGMVSFLFWLDLFMIPILLPWAYANGELSAVQNWKKVGSEIAWSFLILVSLMGGLRAYSINLCVKYASALTKTVADIFTQAVTIYASLFIFKTASTPMLHIGIGITMFGFGLYTFVKFNEKHKKKAEKTVKTNEETVEKEPFLGKEGNNTRNV